MQFSSLSLSWSWSSLRGRFVARGNPEANIVFAVVFGF
jgi:hypothetical protein